MIKSQKLSNFLKIKHGFFNKKGGVSKGIYKSLNCGRGSADLKKNILKNLEIVAKKIKISKKNIILLNQVHSSNVHYISKKKKFQKRLKGDALITDTDNLALGILTADCVPILIYDPYKKIISAIHAGWKGAYKGIIQNVIKIFLRRGSVPKNLVAAIGPCISKKNYEVQKDFMQKFIIKNSNNKKFFYFLGKKTYFSLNSYVYSELKKQGLKNIDLINKDTFNTKNNFFSARRSIKNKDNDYGRNISIIMIN